MSNVRIGPRVAARVFVAHIACAPIETGVISVCCAGGDGNDEGGGVRKKTCNQLCVTMRETGPLFNLELCWTDARFDGKARERLEMQTLRNWSFSLLDYAQMSTAAISSGDYFHYCFLFQTGFSTSKTLFTY